MSYQDPCSTVSPRGSLAEQTEAGSGVDARGDAHAESRVGATLAGRFELVRLLGVGSYGDVYEARDRQNPSTRLALKLLRRPGANARYRFKREFRGLAEASHPNLVALHELILAEHEAFFTMELVPGGDVLSYVRPEGVLDEQRLRHALRGLSAGVSALHELGRLHRDLKPNNVLVDETGRVVIVDFGLATMLGEHDAHVELGFVGTPSYAAPEQLAADGSVGPESDWYAVGTMLYQALSGRAPYRAPLAELAEVKRAPAAPLLGLPASLAPLGELCARMLAPERHARAGGVELLALLGAASTPAPPAVGFFGRQVELAQLAESFARVEHGARACAVVLAPSGLGKTALVERFFAELHASHRALVLRGRCYVNEDVAYRAVDGLVDALSHCLLGLPRADAAALVPSDALALAQLFPVLMRVPAIAAAAPQRALSAQDEASVRERGVRALRELLARLSDRLPIALFIDDLQWDDADSGWLISELLADPDPPSLWLVLACRSDEAERSHVLRALRRDPALVEATCEVALAALARDETIALVSAVIAGAAPEPAQLARIAEESAGHPMFAIELARWSRGPQTFAGVPRALSLEAALRSRAQRLPAPAQRLLELSCAAGHKLTLATALRACGEEASALRELVARKLVSSTGASSNDTLETYHDRVREALLEAMAPEQVRALRVQLARALVQEPSPRFDLIVEHYLAAEQRAEAARYAIAAADLASAVLAFHRVPALIELAIEHAEPAARAPLYVRLGRACSLVGRTRDATRALLAAAALEPDAEQRWELERMAMWQALQGGEVELGLSLLRELDRPFGRHAVHPTWLRQLYSTALLIGWRIAGPPALRAPAPPGPRAALDEKRLRLVWTATTGLAANPMRWLGHFMVIAMQLSARLGNASVYAPLLAGFAASRATLVGRPSVGAEAGIARALMLARTRGDTSSVQSVLLSQALYLANTAETARAAAAVDAALDLPFAPTELGTYLKSVARAGSALLSVWHGSVARTRERAGTWIREAREHAEPHQEYGLRALTAHRFLRDDDAERALAEWSLVHDHFPEHAALRDPVCGAIIGLYAGRIDVAERAFAAAQRSFWGWNAYMAQPRAMLLWTRGAIAAARMASGDRDLRTRLALRFAIWALRMQGARMAAPMLQHLLAVQAYFHGRNAHGLAHLERARAGYAEIGLRLFEACAAHALSRLHPDDEACTARETDARVVFEAERLRHPERWVRALLPGLPEPSQLVESSGAPGLNGVGAGNPAS